MMTHHLDGNYGPVIISCGLSRLGPPRRVMDHHPCGGSNLNLSKREAADVLASYLLGAQCATGWRRVATSRSEIEMILWTSWVC